MAHIQARSTSDGKVRYRVQVRKKGYPIQTATFERKTDARKWAQSIEVAIEEQRFRNHAQAKRRTVGEVVDRYIADYLPRKPRSERVQKQQLVWWKDQVGDKTLAEFTPDVIVEQRDKLAARELQGGKRLSPSSVNRYLAAISHVLTIAVKELRWLPDNPMRSVSKLKEPKPRVRFLSDDERGRLLNACEESRDKHLLPIVVLALSTGMRKSNILNLTWDAVDLERQVIRLEDTKNKERHAVPLSGRAYDLLLALSEKKDGDAVFVFPGKNPSKPIDIKKAWYGALERSGVKDFRFHDLRHSAASYLAMSGATLPEIAGVLGHKTYEMVKRYAHLSEPHTAGVVERMNKKVFGDEH